MGRNDDDTRTSGSGQHDGERAGRAGFLARPVLVENSATGAELGSCCLPVFVDQPGGPGPALDLGGRDGEGDDVRVVIWCAQFHSLALVAAAGVVVADVLGQDHPEVLLAGDEHPIGALSPRRAHEALGIGFILGAWGAVGSVVIPLEANTASNAAVNLVSRSRIR